MEGQQDSRMAGFAEMLKNQIETLRQSLMDDVHGHMELIECPEDIAFRYPYIRIIYEIKQVLEDISIGNYCYKPPPLAAHSSERINKDESVRKLYEFFKMVHVTLWEIRCKLSYMYTYLDTQRLTVDVISYFATALKKVKELNAQLSMSE